MVTALFFVDSQMLQSPKVLYKIVSVVLVKREQADLVRREYIKNQVGKDFRDHAIRECVMEGRETNEHPCLPLDLYTYQVHHIVPISLGGTNNIRNLALVEPNVHHEIHRSIGWEISGLQRGERRTVRLPIRAGLIWTC